MIGTSGDLKTAAQDVAQEGFAILPEVIDHSYSSLLLEELSGLKRAHGRAGLRHVHSQPCIAKLATDKRLMNIACEILGEGALPFRATLFDKSPESNWLITWHQDTALPLHGKHDANGWSAWSVKDGIHYAHAPAEALQQVLAIRVHLDHSTGENGPLRVIPRTHRLGVLNDEAIIRVVGEQKEVTCIVNQGGVIAMRPLLIHASSKSRTSSPRRVLHVEYAATSDLPGGLRLARPNLSSQTSAKPN